MPRAPLMNPLIAAVVSSVVSSAVMAQTTQPATKAADVPVKSVTLFSSGVGYFEHAGEVSGDGSATLPFKAEQINDVLKSLVLQDLDGGSVGVVTYPSQDPLGKILGSFGVDISSNPSLADLLNQLRGAEVTVGTQGQEAATGTILGVETKKRPVAKDGDPVEQHYLNLLTGGGVIQTVDLDAVRSLKLDDPQLQKELGRALAAVASARDQNKKPVQIDFRGTGDRRVRVGYVIETPIWKTSYRLILTAPKANKDEPATRPATGPAAVEGTLQGWAIVENQTDSDWKDIQLSLVSGRPISFVQNLYQPLYVPRPTVEPELYASLTPQEYGGGVSSGKRMEAPDFNLQSTAGRASAAPMAAPVERMARKRGLAMEADKPAQGYFGVNAPATAPMDAAASVAAAASAAKLGELFQYTVANVSLPRQSSAMIPIVSDPVGVQRLSIYNQQVLAEHPLTGAEVTNSTGKSLPAGPVTVYDGGYSGDARIDNLPAGQHRLLSYGIDLDVRVDATKNTSSQTVVAGKIVKGVLEVSRKYVSTQDYKIENKGETDKTLVVEHPVSPGAKLVKTPEPYETTEQVYRFKVPAPAGKTEDFTITQEQVLNQQIVILPSDPSQLAGYLRTGEIPKDVRDALSKAISLKQAAAGTEQGIQENQNQINQIAAEQERIRKNMEAVDKSSQYYNRLLGKLNDQESQIEALQKKVSDLQSTRDKQRADLEDYLKGLNVG